MFGYVMSFVTGEQSSNSTKSNSVVPSTAGSSMISLTPEQVRNRAMSEAACRGRRLRAELLAEWAAEAEMKRDGHCRCSQEIINNAELSGLKEAAPPSSPFLSIDEELTDYRKRYGILKHNSGSQHSESSAATQEAVVTAPSEAPQDLSNASDASSPDMNHSNEEVHSFTDLDGQPISDDGSGSLSVPNSLPPGRYTVVFGQDSQRTFVPGSPFPGPISRSTSVSSMSSVPGLTNSPSVASTSSSQRPATPTDYQLLSPNPIPESFSIRPENRRNFLASAVPPTRSHRWATVFRFPANHRNPLLRDAIVTSEPHDAASCTNDRCTNLRCKTYKKPELGIVHRAFRAGKKLCSRVKDAARRVKNKMTGRKPVHTNF